MRWAAIGRFTLRRISWYSSSCFRRASFCASTSCSKLCAAGLAFVWRRWASRHRPHGASPEHLGLRGRVFQRDELAAHDLCIFQSIVAHPLEPQRSDSRLLPLELPIALRIGPLPLHSLLRCSLRPFRLAMRRRHLAFELVPQPIPVLCAGPLGGCDRGWALRPRAMHGGRAAACGRFQAVDWAHQFQLLDPKLGGAAGLGFGGQLFLQFPGAGAHLVTAAGCSSITTLVSQ